MNRLWIRLSVVIATIVVFVFLFPLILRVTGIWQPDFPRRGFETITPERRAEMQAEFEARAWTQVYQALLVGAVIGVGGGVFLSRWLAAPLKDLETGARAIADQQLDHRVPVHGSAELQSVARSFNRMAAELEGAERYRQNMLADVAHELRHPVHILQGNLQAILDGVYPLNMEEIGLLLVETQHLAALVNDLYELAQAEAHQLPLFKTQVDLALLVANAVEAFQPLATGESIELGVTLPTGPAIADVDGGRVRQALQNLLSNALNHTLSGGKVTVTLDAGELNGGDSAPANPQMPPGRAPRNGWRIQVADTGNGIAPEHLPHVFDRFYRADPSRSREMGGSGLGLAIAQALIQAHGGAITAASPGAGKGSLFTIWLPAQGG